MSAQNVELIKRMLPAEVDLAEVVRSDNPAGAFIGAPGIVDPELEVSFEGTQTGAPRLSYRGLDGLVDGWRDWLTPWKSYVIETEDVVDAGARVIQLARVRCRTSRDDVEVEHRPAAVWTVRDGRVVAVAFYLERDQAFAFAGIDN